MKHKRFIIIYQLIALVTLFFLRLDLRLYSFILVLGFLFWIFLEAAAIKKAKRLAAEEAEEEEIEEIDIEEAIPFEENIE